MNLSFNFHISAIRVHHNWHLHSSPNSVFHHSFNQIQQFQHLHHLPTRMIHRNQKILQVMMMIQNLLISQIVHHLVHLLHILLIEFTPDFFFF